MSNIFIVCDCKCRKNILITPSARKAKKQLHVGTKIEVWNDNTLVEYIYAKDSEKMDKYIDMQKQYIGEKQAKAEQRNKRRSNHAL